MKTYQEINLLDKRIILPLYKVAWLSKKIMDNYNMEII